MTSPLISVDEVAARLDDPLLRIADCRWYLGDGDRGRANYTEGHIPGAVYVDLETHLSAEEGPGRHPLPERPAFAAAMGSLGLGDEHTIVAYDDRGGAVASRLWWMLRDIGHTDVAILDGGLTAWTEAGLPISAEATNLRPASMSVRDPLTRRLTRDEVKASLGSITLIDARSHERYRGDTEPIDPVAGHVPTAINVPYESNLGPDHRFLDAAELAARYPSGDGPVAVYCGSGVTACHDIAAMLVAGLPEPALYPGSWSDWSTSGLPAATGEEPGDPV